MGIVRWDPFRDLEVMNDRLDRIFGRTRGMLANGGEESLKLADWAPFVDIAETEKEFVVKVDLPEVKKEDVKVHVENGVLRIEGERKSEKEEKGKTYHRVERMYGTFTRAFVLPESVDQEKTSAAYKDGVLRVTLPKGGKPKARTVDVQVA